MRRFCLKYCGFYHGYFQGFPCLCLLCTLWISYRSVLILNWIIGMGISGKYIKKITGLAAEASKAQSTFQQYNKLLTLIEETEFKSTYLQKWKAEVVGEAEKTSEIIKKFANQLNSLDTVSYTH